MVIGTIDSTTALYPPLPAQNLLSDRVQRIETPFERGLDEAAAFDANASTGVDGLAVRATLDQRIADDIAAGRLRQEDADRVERALDQAEERAASAVRAEEDDDATSATQSARSDGGNEPVEKNEVSRSETVSNGIRTTVISYADGTTETRTEFDISAEDIPANPLDDINPTQDAFRTGIFASADAYGLTTADVIQDNIVRNYLSTIQPGSLFSAYA